jgi:hypothetical protein
MANKWTLRKRRGLETVEYAVVTGLILVGLIVTVAVFGHYVTQKSADVGGSVTFLTAVCLAALTGLIGATTAVMRSLAASLRGRAQLAILEALSRGAVLSRQDVHSLVRRESLWYLFFGDLWNVVLAELVSQGKVVVKDGNYLIPEKVIQ